MASDPARQPVGVRTGGQFAPTSHHEADVVLDDLRDSDGDDAVLIAQAQEMMTARGHDRAVEDVDDARSLIDGFTVEDARSVVVGRFLEQGVLTRLPGASSAASGTRTYDLARIAAGQLPATEAELGDGFAADRQWTFQSLSLDPDERGECAPVYGRDIDEIVQVSYTPAVADEPDFTTSVLKLTDGRYAIITSEGESEGQFVTSHTVKVAPSALLAASEAAVELRYSWNPPGTSWSSSSDKFAEYRRYLADMR